MKRLVASWMPLVLLGSLGCSMCKNSYDCMYSAYGGVRPRSDMRRSSGRVGSAFDSADGVAVGSPTEAEPFEEIPTPPEPEDAMPQSPDPGRASEYQQAVFEYELPMFR